MQYTLIDLSDKMAEAWREFFTEEKNVHILTGDITQVSCDAIVSPGNSFGFMDGGVDYAISERLGWELQERLQEHIHTLPEGELLVGKALTIPTNDLHIRYLICAPTMRVPMSFNIHSSINAYFAMKAALIAAKSLPDIESVAIPGFCTGIGKMAPIISARQMHIAFCEIELNRSRRFNNFAEAQKSHYNINPQSAIHD